MTPPRLHELSMDPADDPEFLDQIEVAKLLEVTVRTLYRWRAQERGPAFVRVVSTGDFYYRREDVERYLALDRTVTTT